MYEKSRKHHERHCFILFWWTSTQAHLKQIAKMKTPDPNCEKTVALTFTIPSMLPEIIHKTIQCISTQNHPKQITEIKTPYLNCRKTVFIMFMTACMFPEILVCLFVKWLFSKFLLLQGVQYATLLLSLSGTSYLVQQSLHVLKMQT